MNPEHVAQLKKDQEKKGRVVFFLFGLLMLIQILAVMMVVHRRRQALAARGDSGGSTRSGGWSSLTNGGSSSSDTDDESTIPEMEGMDGLPSYAESSVHYSPPKYVVAEPVVARSPPTASAGFEAAAAPPMDTVPAYIETTGIGLPLVAESRA